MSPASQVASTCASLLTSHPHSWVSPPSLSTSDHVLWPGPPSYTWFLEHAFIASRWAFTIVILRHFAPGWPSFPLCWTLLWGCSASLSTMSSSFPCWTALEKASLSCIFAWQASYWLCSRSLTVHGEECLVWRRALEPQPLSHFDWIPSADLYYTMRRSH